MNQSTDKDSVKIVYVILDGIGDLPHASVGNITPLEAAFSPNLDSLTKNGCMGEVITVGKGIAPQSDIAVFNMLGYNFKDKSYVGRGVVESIGSGIDFREGDLALRGNFATINDNLEIIDRRAGRIITAEETKTICNTFNNQISLRDQDASVIVVPTVAHRVTVRFRHKKIKLSDQITNTDPAYDKIDGIGIAKNDITQMQLLQSLPQDNDISSKVSSDLVNDFSDQVMLLTKNHPINIARIERKLSPMNCILVRDAGNKIPKYIPIKQKYDLNFACIVDMPVEIGISKILGMDSIEAGEINDYITKAKVTAKQIEKYNVIYVHIKGPDEFGHDGDALGKKKNIEEIDKDFFATLLRELRIPNSIIVVSGDHSTPCIKMRHSDDPVPLLISGNDIKKDGSRRFTEKFAKAGILGTIMGSDILDTTINMIK